MERVTAEADMEQAQAAMRTLRAEVDRLDDEIVRLLTERIRRALEIGGIKRRLSMAVRQRQREAEVLARVRQHGTRLGGPRVGEATGRMFESIVSEVLRLQESGIDEPIEQLQIESPDVPVTADGSAGSERW
jgi:chorismate mutase